MEQIKSLKAGHAFPFLSRILLHRVVHAKEGSETEEAEAGYGGLGGRLDSSFSAVSWLEWQQEMEKHCVIAALC